MLFPTATFAIFFLIVLPVSWALQPRRRAWMAMDPARQLRLLRLVGLEVRRPADRVHGRQPRPRARDPPLDERRARARASSRSPSRSTSACSPTSSTRVSSSARSTTSSARRGSSTSALPVGISFYTFMAISYVVDTYRGEIEPASFARFAVFQAFFPHLVAGPIVRASELMPQLESPRDPRRVDNPRAFFLIVSGLFLKVVIANHLATHIVDEVFAAPEPALVARGAGRDLRLRRPDLRRLLRVHEHRDRHRAAARLRVPAELQLAVHGGLAPATSGAAGT